MNRPLAVALATVLLAGAAGLAVAQPKGPMAMPPPSMNVAKIPAGHYVSDPRHGGLILKVQHMGMDQSMFRMDKWSASIDYDPAHPDASHVQATIDANSLDQGDPSIGPTFAKEFLDAPNHPTVTFDANHLRRTGANTGVLSGQLTIGGVTRPFDLDVTFHGFRPAGNMGPLRMGFSGHGLIHRADFGIGKTMPLAVIGDVEVELNAEFTKAA
jgi:polyisoprenoid-binding protein YceI